MVEATQVKLTVFTSAGRGGSSREEGKRECWNRSWFPFPDPESGFNTESPDPLALTGDSNSDPSSPTSSTPSLTISTCWPVGNGEDVQIHLHMNTIFSHSWP